MKIKIEEVEIVEKEDIFLDEVYFIENSEIGNYITNGIISSNCSTSLELGIDIGSVDYVIQITSPKSVTRAIQRIGRSGHSIYEESKGYLIAMSRDDLLEQAAIGRGILKRSLDKVHIPKNCLDVLAQHIVGMSLERTWKLGEMLNIIKKAYPYRTLSEETFKKVVEYLAGKYVELEYQNIYAKIRYDEETQTISGKKGMLPIYLMNVGTIPEEVQIDVYLRGLNRKIGSIEEDFLEKLKSGDIFVLGGKPYRFLYARGVRAYVEKAEGLNPNIPSWFSEQLPLSFETAMEVCRLIKKVVKLYEEGKSIEEMIKEICKEYPVGEKEAKIIIEYVLCQLRYARFVPSDELILIEKTSDLEGKFVVIFHSIFGRKVNEILSKALSALISEMYEISVPMYLSDHAFGLILPPDLRKISYRKLLLKLAEENVGKYVYESIKNTELFKIRFRHVANRGLLILRKYKGKKVSLRKQNLTAELLAKYFLEYCPNFPLVVETVREILEDAMDINNAKKILENIREGKIRVEEIQTKDPSPFAHELLIAYSFDILKIDERQRLLRELDEKIKRRLKKI